MGKKALHKKSKRLTLSTKYLIKKKSKIAQKKKAGKKSKDPGIPQCVPYIVEEINEAKETKKKMKEADKAHMKKRALLSRNLSMEEQKPNKSNNRTESAASAHITKLFNVPFKNQLSKVIAESDIVLQVLDVRNPQSCRSLQIEKSIQDTGKKLIFILNKIDLVSRVNVEQWIIYLRQFFPTVPFKCNLQTEQAKKRGGSGFKRKSYNFKSTMNKHFDGAAAVLKRTSTSFGVNEVMSQIHKLIEGNGTKKVIVGVVGLPNTGKSALINTLKHIKICPSSSMPGLTRSCQVVQLSKNIHLVDSPGICLMANKVGEEEMVFRNCLKLEEISDVRSSAVYLVEKLINCGAKECLLERYRSGEFNSGNQFIVCLAKRFGLLKKGGLIDVDRAAKRLLQDWRDGILPFYSEPPFLENINENDVIEVRNELSSRSLNGLFFGESNGNKGMICALPNFDIESESFNMDEMVAEEDEGDDSGSDEEDEDSCSDNMEMAA